MSSSLTPASNTFLQVGQVQVWIAIDDRPIGVYQIREEKHKITCFIESIEGKTFTVHWRNLEKDQKIRKAASIYLDGVRVSYCIFAENNTDIQSVRGYRASATSRQPFQFAPLKTTDDETRAVNVANRLKELSSIRVNVNPVELHSQNRPLQPLEIPAGNAGPVHEKTGKGQAHRITLGDAVQTTATQCSTVRSLGLDSQDFIFSYGPLEWLQARGVVPRPPPTPTPAPSTSNPPRSGVKREHTIDDDIDMDLLDPDDLLILNRIREKQALKKARITVKQEPIEVPPHLIGTVIDLTS